MTSKPRLIFAAVAGIMAAVTWSLTPPARTADPAPVKILTIGDSITHNGTVPAVTSFGPAYRTELSRLLGLANVAHVYEVSAWPGQSCAYIANELPAQMAAYTPDLVILSCGTNDAPGTTESAYRSILATLGTTPAVISWIGYIDPRIAPQAPWLLPNQRAANDAIYRARFFTPAATPPVADFQVIPGDAEHLVPYNGTTPDGIHPTARGYKAMAHIVYAKAAPLMGWPSLAALGEPPVCGLRGNWHQYPEPLPSRDYQECTQP